MITDIKNSEFGIEGKVKSELFNETIDVVIEEEAGLEYAEKCAVALNNLSEAAISAICKASKNYCLYMIDICEDFSDEMSVEINESTPPEEILKCIHPTTLIIDEPEEDSIGFHLECECDWEPEHGLELTFRDGRLIYAGPFEDCGPWNEYDEDDEYNFVNSIN